MEFLETISQHTNDEIERVFLQLMKDNLELQTYHHHTDAIEIQAFIGLLYHAGAWKSANVDVHELWGNDGGLSLFRCVMPRMRFTFLCICIRFDDKTKRNKMDRFAPVREIWNAFINNCQICYEMSDVATVDEQLLSFRGRCKFRMFIKAKPDRYGLKIVTLNDAKTAYFYNGIPYLGKSSLNDSLPGETKPEFFFREVTTPIHDTNRTVTCDNWFTSIPLLERFKQNPYNLTMTGTIRKNKREIPAEMKLASKTVPDTKFCFSSSNVTLLSHTPQKKKVVLVASTFSKSTKIIEGKPEIILYYNKSKGGTDTFDQLCHAYTVARKTNRWPLRVFYGILDQAAVNAKILLKLHYINEKIDTKVKTCKCLRYLALHLTKPLLQSRLNNPLVRTSIRIGIKTILNVNAPQITHTDRPTFPKKLRCQLCPRKVDKKSRMQCPSCKRVMCENHRVYLCNSCGGQE